MVLESVDIDVDVDAGVCVVVVVVEEKGAMAGVDPNTYGSCIYMKERKREKG